MLYTVEEGGSVSYMVVAQNKDHALSIVRESQKKALGDELIQFPEGYELVATEATPGQEIRFEFDGTHITHTTEEWSSIYHGHWGIIASSEY